jgi:hypothetical protein
MVYGRANCESSPSKNDQVKHSAWGKHKTSSSRSSGMHKANVLSWWVFLLTGIKVFVERPGYRIDSRTIKRSFKFSSLITSSHGAQSFAYFVSPYLIASCVSLYEILELVASFSTSSISSKWNPYASSIAFSSWEVLPVLHFGRFHTSPHLVFSLLTILGVSLHKVVIPVLRFF